MAEHVLTGEDRGYAVVATDAIQVDGVRYVVLLDGDEVKVSGLGSIIALHEPEPPVRAAVGDVVWLEARGARLEWVRRPGGRPADLMLGAVTL